MIFPEPYYWWESGLAFDSLATYWAMTGDEEYNDLVGEALLSQEGTQQRLHAAESDKDRRQ